MQSVTAVWDATHAGERQLRVDSSVELALLARCLGVERDLQQRENGTDPIAGRTAADALDQAIELLDELAAWLRLGEEALDSDAVSWAV